MLKRFYRDSALYTLSVILTRGVSFFLLPVYTAVLTPEEFGTFDYLAAVGNVIGVVITFEVAQGIHRYIPEVMGNASERQSYASTALIFTIFCYLLLIVGVAFFAPQLANALLGNPDSSAVIVMATVMFAVNAILALAQGQLRSELRVGENITSSIVASLSSSLLSVIALLWCKAGVLGLIAGISLGNGIGALYALTCCRDAYRPLFSVWHLRELLSFSMPLVSASVGVVATNYIDRFMIKSMMSLGDLGVFGVSARIAMITSLLSIGVRQSLTPLIYNKYKDPGTPTEIARLFWTYCVLSLVVIAAISLSAPFILALAVSKNYAEAAALVPFSCASALFSTLYIFAPGLTLAKKTGIASLVSLATAALCVIFNFVLISAFGLVGAVVGTLMATVIGFFIYATAGHRYYPVPYFSFASDKRVE